MIELLIVVAIIGILAAVAVPNLLNAIDKSKQKRTMVDLRSIGSAVEAYAVDHARYPAAVSNWATLSPLITPLYQRTPPEYDGWDQVWDVATAASGADYTVASRGKDFTSGPRGGGETTDFDCDIVFSNGRFFQWPEGTQS